jgi:prefoldin subunit 5
MEEEIEFLRARVAAMEKEIEKLNINIIELEFQISQHDQGHH